MRQITSKRPLSFQEYQDEANKTDQTGADPQDGILVSVLGIVGEAGDLATLFKKKLRDGNSFTVYPEQCGEELGDILWYIATLCRKLGLSLDEIACNNLVKTKARWGKFDSPDTTFQLFDQEYPTKEQIPRIFTITFKEHKKNGRQIVQLFRNGEKCGDTLTDNSYFEDGYRYHDVFHLAYAGVLGWSPVTRKILNCKRKSNQKVDEIEDGGRSSVIEEGISALVFQYAEKHNLLDGVGRIDSELLSLIIRLTGGLEVRKASAAAWENAILSGYQIFRLLNKHRGGAVAVNLNKRTLNFHKNQVKGR